jgi:DNA-binding transcriptional MerR regulator
VRIGEAAALAGVSPDTVRHYERRGLLPAAPRTASGYRQYSRDSVKRIQLVQRALVIGFSLDELGQVLRERDRGGAPCRGVRMLVEQRLAALERQLEELASLRAELRSLIGEWDERLRGTPAGHRAHLLDTLAGRPAIDRVRGSLRRGGPDPRRAARKVR